MNRIRPAMNKPRWAKTRAKQLRDLDRFPQRIVLGYEFGATLSDWSIQAAHIPLMVVPEPTFTPRRRLTPHRRTWRHRS